MLRNIYQDESPKVYFGGIILFSLMFFLSILGSLRVGILLKEKSIVSPESIIDFLLSLLIFGVFLLLFSAFKRIKKEKSILKGIFFYVIIFWGSLVSLNFFLPNAISLLIFLSLFSAYLINRKVWLHNILTILGFSGIVGVIGFSFPSIIVFTFLFLFALYIKGNGIYEDYDNNIFGLIIPRNILELSDSLKRRTKQYIVVKAGMFILPGMLCASVASVNIEKAIIIGIFSVLGFITSSHLFSFERKCSCQGSIMTIFFFTAFGYLLSVLF